MQRLFDKKEKPSALVKLYETLTFQPSQDERPFVYLNMVSTVEGKTVLGKPGSSAEGVGSKTDQVLMKRLRKHADAVLIGANTLRNDKNMGYENSLLRGVVTISGEFDFTSDFFTAERNLILVFAPHSLPKEKQAAILEHASLVLCGDKVVNVKEVLLYYKSLGVKLLLCEGGGSLNASLFEAKAVDELFLTIAPKIRGGTDSPSIVEGDKLANPAKLELLSCYEHEGELYLRYSVKEQSKRVINKSFVQM